MKPDAMNHRRLHTIQNQPLKKKTAAMFLSTGLDEAVEANLLILPLLTMSKSEPTWHALIIQVTSVTSMLQSCVFFATLWRRFSSSNVLIHSYRGFLNRSEICLYRSRGKLVLTQRRYLGVLPRPWLNTNLSVHWPRIA